MMAAHGRSKLRVYQLISLALALLMQIRELRLVPVAKS